MGQMEGRGGLATAPMTWKVRLGRDCFGGGSKRCAAASADLRRLRRAGCNLRWSSARRLPGEGSEVNAVAKAAAQEEELLPQAVP